MSIKNKQQYLDGLKNQSIELYLFGEKVNDIVNHPCIRPSINAAAMTYELAEEDECRNLFIVKSNLSGENINRFTHIHQSTEDLIKKERLERLGK